MTVRSPRWRIYIIPICDFEGNTSIFSDLYPYFSNKFIPLEPYIRCYLFVLFFPRFYNVKGSCASFMHFWFERICIGSKLQNFCFQGKSGSLGMNLRFSLVNLKLEAPKLSILWRSSETRELRRTSLFQLNACFGSETKFWDRFGLQRCFNATQPLV